MSLSESASDKKRVLQRANEGNDGGVSGGKSSLCEPALSLYKACLDTLNELCDQCVKRKDLSVANTYRICEIETRLLRFDEESLHNGILDDCLKGDKGLHDHVINQLGLLGTTLLGGMSIIISRSSHSVSTSPF